MTPNLPTEILDACPECYTCRLSKEFDALAEEVLALRAENERLKDICDERAFDVEYVAGFRLSATKPEIYIGQRVNDVNILCDLLEAATAQNAKYREALEFYARQTRVHCREEIGAAQGMMGPTAPIYTRDDGNVARAALGDK